MKENKCPFCNENDNYIKGKILKYYDFKATSGYKDRFVLGCDINLIDNLDVFILRGSSDKKAGLMIDTGNGARYVDISYCPFCGRKLDNKEK